MNRRAFIELQTTINFAHGYCISKASNGQERSEANEIFFKLNKALNDLYKEEEKKVEPDSVQHFKVERYGTDKEITTEELIRLLYGG